MVFLYPKERGNGEMRMEGNLQPHKQKARKHSAITEKALPKSTVDT